MSDTKHSDLYSRTIQVDYEKRWKWALGCHELGHAVIHWHFKNGLDEEGVWIDTETGKGGFHVRSHFSGAMIAAVLRNSLDEEGRALFIRDVEREIIRLLGGPVAEFLAGGSNPTRAIRFCEEYRNSGSDSARIRDLLRGLTGKDDKEYQMRLQDECKAILIDERAWRAIEHLAEMLVDRSKLSGPEIEAVFQAFEVPRTINW
jgi:hypothetical protein